MLCAATREQLEASAFVNPDGSLAVVVMNRGEQALPFALHLGSAGCAAVLPPRSIATLASAGTTMG